MSKTLTLASVSLAATLLQDIASNHPKVNSITWTPSVDILKEEGLVLSDSGDDNLSDSQKMAKVVENGISYVVWMEGQKIGFYADQRENCQYISSISKGQKVLDICCYTGGFALNAASGGALSVIGIAKCIWDVQEFKFPGYTINKKRRTVNNLLMWVITGYSCWVHTFAFEIWFSGGVSSRGCCIHSRSKDYNCTSSWSRMRLSCQSFVPGGSIPLQCFTQSALKLNV